MLWKIYGNNLYLWILCISIFLYSTFPHSYPRLFLFDFSMIFYVIHKLTAPTTTTTDKIFIILFIFV